MKKAQEEMMGFALIIIIVMIILMVFLSFYLRQPKESIIQSYETENFIQAVLPYTTKCYLYYEPNYLTIEGLIKSCNSNDVCFNGENTCDVLKNELNNIVEISWDINNQSVVKGYSLNINYNSENVISLEKGNKTLSGKGSIQNLPNNIDIYFELYY